MKYFKQSFGLMLMSATALAQGPTATISYSVNSAVPATPVPVFGAAGLAILGLLTMIVGARWIRKHPSSTASRFVFGAISMGLVSSLSSGAWLVNNAQAVTATIYLFSEASNPLVVNQIPAELNNDLSSPVTLDTIEIAGCPGDLDFQSTCSEGTQLAANSGSCAIDSLCAVVPGTCGDEIVDEGEEFDPPPGPFTSAPVSAESCRYDFSSAPQFYCNGSCSISGASGCDQTEADRFCKLKLDDPDAIATSFTTTSALAQPGFACTFLDDSNTVEVDMSSRGVNEVIRYQDSSILANHGSGEVIDSVVCTVP